MVYCVPVLSIAPALMGAGNLNHRQMLLEDQVPKLVVSSMSSWVPPYQRVTSPKAATAVLCFV